MPSLVSIAMATRNAEQFVKDALDSVGPALEGSGAAYEILLADGQSTDGTLSVASASPNVTIVSHKDCGIYDGMNRAVAAAKGGSVLILNSDDVLLPGALGRAVRQLEREAHCEMVSGSALFGTTAATALTRRNERPLTLEGALFGIPVINARLFRTSFMRRLGPLRTDIGLGADREFMVRAALLKARSFSLDEPLYFYRSHEGSQTMANTSAGRRRVYLAEAEVAAHYLNEPAPDAHLQRLARSMLALANLKLKLTGGAECAVAPAAERPGLRDHLRALRLAFAWRGRLSGA